MARSKRKPPAPQRPVPPVAAEVRREFVTFRPVASYEISRMEQAVPSSFNGVTCVRQYRITVELVDEPIEAIHARIIDLWEHNDNHHQWDPILTEAARYGLDLTPYNPGSKAVRRG